MGLARDTWKAPSYNKLGGDEHQVQTEILDLDITMDSGEEMYNGFSPQSKTHTHKS